MKKGEYSRTCLFLCFQRLPYVLRTIYTRQVLLTAYLNASFSSLDVRFDQRREDQLITELLRDGRLSAQIIASYGFGRVSTKLCSYKKRLTTHNESQRIHLVEKILAHTDDFMRSSLDELEDFIRSDDQLEVSKITSCCFKSTVSRSGSDKPKKHRKKDKKGQKNKTKQKHRKGKKNRKNKRRHNKTDKSTKRST